MISQPENEHPPQAPGDNSAPKARDRRRRWLRRLLCGLVALPILLVMLLVLVTSGPVLRFAMPTVERAVSAAIQGRFEAGDIHGSLWTTLTIDRLTIESKATGLSIDGRRLQLAWSPLALLSMVIQVDRLAADSLTVVLPRAEAEQAPEERPGKTGPFSLPLAVRLGELSVSEFHLVDPASGRRFSSTITGSGAVGENLTADLALNLLPLDDSVDQFRARLAFTADKKNLQVDISGRFARDGIVMTLAGLQPDEATDVTISLKGDGPVAQWQGNLAFTAADWTELSARIGLQLGEEQLGFTVSGTTDTLGRLAEQLPEPLRGPITLDVAGQFAMESHRLALSKFNLTKADLLSLSSSAALDPEADRLVADLQAKIDPAAGKLLGDRMQWQDLALKVHAEGRPAMPEAKLTVTSLSVTTPVSTIGELSITASTATRDDHLAVDVQGTAHGNAWHDAKLADMLGDHLDIAAKADIAPDFSRFIVENLTVAVEGMHLTGRAELDGRGNVSAADLQADVDDLSIFAGISGLQLSGTGRVAVGNVLWGLESGGQADIEVTTDQLAFGQADLDRLVGPQPVMAAKVNLSPQQDLAISLDRLQTAMADGTFSIALTEEFRELQVNGKLTVQPGGVPPAAGVSLPKAAQLSVSLAGPLAAPAGKIQVQAPALNAGTKRFDNLDLNSTISWTDKNVLSLGNRLDFALKRKPYRLQADVLLPPERLQLTMTLKGDAVDLAGKLELPEYRPPATGSVNLAKLDAGLLGDLGMPLAAGRITAKVDLRSSKGRQQLDVEAAADRLRLTGGDKAKPNSIERLRLHGSVADALGAPVVDAQFEGDGIVVGKVSGERLQATLHGPLTKMHTAVEARGQIRKKLPVKLAAAAVVARKKDIRLAVDRLDIDIGSQRIALREPLLLTRTAAGELAGRASLTVGSGRLDGDVRLVPGRSLVADADLRDIQLAPWSELLAAKRLAGTLSLTGSLNERAGKKPQGRITADIHDIRLADTAHLPPLKLQFDSSLNAKGATASLLLGSQDLRLLQAEAEVPLNLSLLRGRAKMDTKAPISARANIDGEISRFWPYVPLPDHALAGRLKVAAKLSGTLTAPDWDGVLSLENGRYEHLQYGTLLRNLRIDGRFDRRGLRISQISADDGAGGRLKGKAEVGLDAESALGYYAEMTMRKMALTRMDELRLWADVDLDVAGDAREAKINSQVTVHRGEIDLGVAFPPSVPQLDVENLRETVQKRKEEEQEEEAGPFASHLDVTVNIPARLFVRGKGLESEWGGRLDITGSAAAPQIKGELHSRRGQLDVISKDFMLRDSRITFTGGQPPDPLLNITGVHTTEQLVAIASLTGPASQAKLKLSSEPELPQDEILSRMMFGKSQGNLNAVEAIQLASAASSLLGVGGNLDIVGSLRKFLGMDVLRVEGGENGPALRVGKYLAEGVYVGTKQVTTGGSTGIVVEIELTPSIKVTNENNDLGNKTGLQFKWDY